MRLSVQAHDMSSLHLDSLVPSLHLVTQDELVRFRGPDQFVCDLWCKRDGALAARGYLDNLHLRAVWPIGVDVDSPGVLMRTSTEQA